MNKPTTPLPAADQTIDTATAPGDGTMTESTTTTSPDNALLGWIGLALAMAKVQRRRVVPKRQRPLHRV